MSQNLQHRVVIEKGPTSYGAYVPDLPACIAVGETREEVLALIKEAVEFHVEGLCEQGGPIPELCTSGEFVEVTAA